MRSLTAISADGLLSPKLTLHPCHEQGEDSSFGWGVGWYPEGQSAAVVHKEPLIRTGNASTDKLIESSDFRSTCFLCKVRGGAQSYTQHETQPFSRNFAGSQWLFAHSGELDKQGLEQLRDTNSRFLEPLGRTDSELAFCYLLGKLQSTDARTLQQVDPATMRLWLSALDLLGAADVIITDGTTLVTYHGQNSRQNLYYSRLSPPTDVTSYEAEHVKIQFDDPRDPHRTKLLVSSARFNAGYWTQMEPGQLLIACQGAIVWNSHIHLQPASSLSFPSQAKQSKFILEPAFTCIQAEQAQMNRPIMNARSITRSPEGSKLAYRLFDITHCTEYNYSEPVLHSTHTFRLQPHEYSLQEVEYSAISISSPGEKMQFEDVFGNQALHYTILEPYSALKVECQSRIKVFARPEDDLSQAKRQTTIPLAWMPWQRQMMTPYLLPHELPDTQLEELFCYAMSFVERNDYHLLDTLKDINTTIYTDFTYSQGETSNDTTPFDVYTKRLGVCQDFANIFICLARLLGVPARYQMGYIYTGASYENKLQSDASHAWVELYLPYIGWRGFDPTNGCLVGQDHICVARGRNYRDATPTSGTLFKGGGVEKLSVTVKVQEV